MEQEMIGIPYIAASLVIGYLGRQKSLKFWGHALVSLLLTPIVGLLALGIDDWILSRKDAKEEEHKHKHA
jgi:hypothetical protein